jgi:hypothetical protein
VRVVEGVILEETRGTRVRRGRRTMVYVVHVEVLRLRVEGVGVGVGIGDEGGMGVGGEGGKEVVSEDQILGITVTYLRTHEKDPSNLRSGRGWRQETPQHRVWGVHEGEGDSLRRTRQCRRRTCWVSRLCAWARVRVGCSNYIPWVGRGNPPASSSDDVKNDGMGS